MQPPAGDGWKGTTIRGFLVAVAISCGARWREGARDELEARPACAMQAGVAMTGVRGSVGGAQAPDKPRTDTKTAGGTDLPQLALVGLQAQCLAVAPLPFV